MWYKEASKNRNFRLGALDLLRYLCDAQALGQFSIMVQKWLLTLWTPGGDNFVVTSEHMLQIKFINTCETDSNWMLWGTFNDKSTLAELWLGAAMQQAITWSNIGPDLRRHIGWTDNS